MKITHLSNSFILVESQNVKICCDPWVGRANYGGWHSFPEFEKNDIINYLKDFDIVYISHLHDDHLDIKFLKESGLYDKKFIIKNIHIAIKFITIFINKFWKIIIIRSIGRKTHSFSTFIMRKIYMSRYCLIH